MSLWCRNRIERALFARLKASARDVNESRTCFSPQVLFSHLPDFFARSRTIRDNFTEDRHYQRFLLRPGLVYIVLWYRTSRLYRYFKKPETFLLLLPSNARPTELLSAL